MASNTNSHTHNINHISLLFIVLYYYYYYNYYYYCSLKMDLVIVPLVLELRGLCTLEIPYVSGMKITLFKATIWRYQSPSIRKPIFFLSTKKEDTSPPAFDAPVDTSVRYCCSSCCSSCSSSPSSSSSSCSGCSLCICVCDWCFMSLF